MGSAERAAAESAASRPYHQSASVGQSPIIAAAVPSATSVDTRIAASERTGPTGSLTGRLLMMRNPSVPSSPKCAGFSIRNAPYSTANVTAPASANTVLYGAFRMLKPAHFGELGT